MLSLKAFLHKPHITLLAQIPLLPVIDNTATANSPIWSQNKLAPWLTPNRMLWYRKMYLPNEEDWLKWTASPNFALRKVLGGSPRTWIAVAECDLLAPEALAYGKQLEEVQPTLELTHSRLKKSRNNVHLL